MEENNKLETTIDNSGSGSMLYGAEPQRQTPDGGYSSVYGGGSEPVGLAKPSEQAPQGVMPVQLAKSSGQAPTQGTIPVQTQGTVPEQQSGLPVQSQGAVPVQLTKPLELVSPQGAMPVQQPGTSVPPQGATVPVQLTKSAEQEMSVQQPGTPVLSSGTPVPPYGVSPVQQPGAPMPPQGAMPAQQPGTPVPPSWQSSPVPPQVQPGNGQPGMNPMGFGPMQVPPPVQGAPAGKPRKNGAGIIVGILCAAAVVIVIAIGVLAVRSFLGGNPQKQLAMGIQNMEKEMEAYQSKIAESIGWTKLNERIVTQPVHTNFDFSFTDPNSTSSITNVAIKLDGVTDYGNKMAEYGVDVGAYGFSMNVANIVEVDNTLYFSVPMVFEDEVYSIELTNLGNDFNNSAWSSFLDETLPEDYALTLFEDVSRKEDSGESGAGNGFLEIFQRKSGVDTDFMEIEALRQKREFTFDGITAEYSGVRVTIDREVYNEAVEEMRDSFLESDFYMDYLTNYQMAYADDFDAFKEELDQIVEHVFGIRFEQDVVYDFYFDKKGRIVNISTPEDVAVSGGDSDIESFAVDINFTGTERTLDSIEGGIYVKVGDEILCMGISRTASVTEEYYSENLTLCMQESSTDDEITFWYANEWGFGDQSFDLQMSFDGPDWSLGVRADGAFTDVVKGESCTLQINHGALSIDGEDMLLMTGSIEVEPTDETIEVPENAIDLLKMSERDIEELIYGALY